MKFSNCFSFTPKIAPQLGEREKTKVTAWIYILRDYDFDYIILLVTYLEMNQNIAQINCQILLYVTRGNFDQTPDVPVKFNANIILFCHNVRSILKVKLLLE